jgi:phage terminase large subunit
VARSLRITTPRVFSPLLQPSRYKGAHGGRGSGKSHFFAELLIERCLLRPTRAVCIREVQRSLDQSVKLLLEDKIKSFGLGGSFEIMNTHINTPNDGIIIFNGMQNHTAESIKSLEGYDVAWVEEAQSLSQRSLDLLRPTIRLEDSELWFSWNPRHKTDPIDVLLRSKELPPDAIVVRANYQDNPHFPEILRVEMEWDRRTNFDKYLHVWMGGYEKHSDSRVFKNWRVDNFDAPADAVFRHGGDWGFSADPTVLSRLYERRPPNARKQLFIDWDVYKIGCEIDHTPALFDRLGCKRELSPLILEQVEGETPKNPALLSELMTEGYRSARRHTITADSARPETISYLRRHGYPRIVAAKKGPNSVKEGVIFLQGYDIVIHERCVHTIDEFTMYSYEMDPLTNAILPILEDKKNHVIDSVRYSVEDLRATVWKQREAVYG